MFRIISAITILFLTACAPTSQAPTVSTELAQKEADIQREIALKDTRKNYDRLQRVADPILLANVDLCGDKIAPYYGMTFSSLDVIDENYHNVVRRLYGTEVQPTVYYVAAKSPARNTLKMADMVLEINGKKIKSGKAGLAQVNKYLADEKEIGKTTSFTIDRAGVQKQVTVTPKTACKGKAIVQENSQVNAFADGKNIIMTSGMMGFASKDSELALVIGHELAHNSRKHIESKQGNAVVGAIFGAVLTGVTGINMMNLGSGLGASAFSQGFEAEADYVGLYHTARAGYNIKDAPNFWRRMGAKNPGGIHLAGTSHPSTAKRFVALEQTVKEISAKRASGRALKPEEKSQEEFKAKISDVNN